MLAPNSSYSISSLAALREVNQLTSPMTKTQAETVLASFVAKGWLLKSKCVGPFLTNRNLTSLITEQLPSTRLPSHRKGRYSLSPRALLELQPYLKSTYPDEILDCTICFEVSCLCHTFQSTTTLNDKKIAAWTCALTELTGVDVVDSYARSRVS